MRNHRRMAMTLIAKPNHPNGSVQKSQDRKKHGKFGQMWRFYSLFSAIAMVWSIMNSCYKVVRSIRNTSLKLCADCAKQFVRNAQSYGKTNHGFCTTKHIDACAWVFGKKQNRNRASTTILTGLGPSWLFFFPKLKTPMKGKRFATIEEIKEK